MPEFEVRKVLTPEQVKALRYEMVPAYDGPVAPNPTADSPTFVRDVDTGELVAVVTLLPDAHRAALRQSLQSLRMMKTARTGKGMGRDAIPDKDGGDSRTFGWMHRRPLAQSESCRVSSMATEFPQQHDVLTNLGGFLSEEFRHIYPEQAAHDAEVFNESVLPEWRMSESALFTSGVVGVHRTGGPGA